MSKKKPPPPPTIEEQKAHAIAALKQWDRTPMSLIPPPTRTFEPGEAAVSRVLSPWLPGCRVMMWMGCWKKMTLLRGMNGQ